MYAMMKRAGLFQDTTAFTQTPNYNNLIKYQKLMSNMKKSDSSLYLWTTIYAIVGTLIYSGIAYYLYPSLTNYYYIGGVFVLVWLVYYLIAKKKSY